MNWFFNVFLFTLRKIFKRILIKMENKSQKTKRSRGNNFGTDEELLFLSEIEKFKNIVECKINKINSTEKVSKKLKYLPTKWSELPINFRSNLRLSERSLAKNCISL
jgi:hypothetical protein